MKEYLICPNCSAPVEINEYECEYCSSVLRENEIVIELRSFIKQIDQKFADASMEDIISECENSKFNNHPIVSFRKLKAELITLMTDDGIFDFDDFQKIYRTSQKLGSISVDYIDNFILYFEVLFPTSHTEIPLMDFKNIRNVLSGEEAFNSRLLSKVISQMVYQEMGVTQYREYSFYLDPKNFIEDEFFKKKKLALERKYESIINKL